MSTGGGDTPSTLHPVLLRQLRRALGQKGVSASVERPDQQSWEELLRLVSDSYESFDADNRLLEHSLDLTSTELVAKNQRLRNDLEREQALRVELRDKQQRLDFQRDRMPLGLIEWDAEWRVVEWNPAAEALFGWTRSEMMGHSTTERIVPKGVRRATSEVVDRLLTGNGGEYAINENVSRDGTRIVCEWFNTPLVDEDGEVTGAVSLVRDVTERVRWQEELLRSSRLDHLTQLPNRRFFIESVDRSLALFRRDRAARFSLLFIDLDRFKQVNDSLGHSVGDGLLVAIARRLQREIREGDLVARLGGDEFAVMLMGAPDHEVGMRTAIRLGEALKAPFEVDGRQLDASASIGVAPVSERFASAEDMLRDADIAMYRAKVRGRGGVSLFDSAMADEVRSRIALERDLSNAVASGQLALVYQPIIHLETGKLAGLEALLRWQHPTRGAIPPSEFVPLAEESGLIVSIGAWVIEQAVAQRAAWQQLVPDEVWLSVNLSARQLMHPDLPTLLDGCMEREGVPSAQIAVEITETSMVRGDDARVGMRTLKSLGVKTLMDDFGTGYASLANLVRFDVDVVKIDRTFIMQATRHGRDFLRAILDLAASLGKPTIAEGVEIAEELELVKELGTDFAQGYLMSHPLPPEGLVAWYLSRTEGRPVLVQTPRRQTS